MLAAPLRFLLLCLLSLGLAVLPGCRPAPSAHSEVIHLTLWQGVNPPPNRDVLKTLVDRFNREHPTIQVESLYVGQSDQQLPKILAAIAGNAVPDLLWFAPTLTGQLVELDAIRPLEDWLQASPLQSELDPVLRESMALEGHLWSVPFGMSNLGIFYRPSLFRAAGITQLPRTWAEFRQTARQLTRDTNGDDRPDQHGIVLPLGKGEWTVFTWLPFMWSGGGELVTSDAAPSITGSSNPGSSNTLPSNKVQLDNSGAIAALQLWHDLLQDGSAVLSAPERGYELDGFLAGKVAMQISGPWTLGQLQTTGVEFGVLPIPAGIRRATTIGGENVFVLKTTPDREKAAFTFAEYILSEPFQTEWAVKTGYLPINLKSRQSPQYREFVARQPAVDVFLQQAPYGRSRPIFPGYSRVSENLGRAIEAVLLNRNTAIEALQAAQQRVNLVFNQSH